MEKNKIRREFDNINQNIPGEHHTTYTSDHNPEKEKKSSPFCYTVRALLPFISMALHLMSFENVLNVKEIWSIITETLYRVIQGDCRGVNKLHTQYTSFSRCNPM